MGVGGTGDGGMGVSVGGGRVALRGSGVPVGVATSAMPRPGASVAAGSGD